MPQARVEIRGYQTRRGLGGEVAPRFREGGQLRGQIDLIMDSASVRHSMAHEASVSGEFAAQRLGVSGKTSDP
jgi:hypothetical protein